MLKGILIGGYLVGFVFSLAVFLFFAALGGKEIDVVKAIGLAIIWPVGWWLALSGRI